MQSIIAKVVIAIHQPMVHLELWPLVGRLRNPPKPCLKPAASHWPGRNRNLRGGARVGHSNTAAASEMPGERQGSKGSTVGSTWDQRCFFCFSFSVASFEANEESQEHVKHLKDSKLKDHPGQFVVSLIC